MLAPLPSLHTPPAAAVASGARASVPAQEHFADFDDFQSAGDSVPTAQPKVAAPSPATPTDDLTAQFGQFGFGNSGLSAQDQAGFKPPQPQTQGPPKMGGG